MFRFVAVKKHIPTLRTEVSTCITILGMLGIKSMTSIGTEAPAVTHRAIVGIITYHYLSYGLPINPALDRHIPPRQSTLFCLMLSADHMKTVA